MAKNSNSLIKFQMTKGMVIMATFLAGLSGCSTPDVKAYKDETPKLRLEQYLDGAMEAHGFFEDRTGLIVKRFKVLMKASWQGETGVLEEDFEYSDGTTSRRVWHLKKISENKYSGTASDVVGEALGEVAGNAFRWKYTLRLPVGSKTYDVNFDDWMYLMDDQVMLNKSKMSKFGFYLGEVTLVFLKRKP